MGQPESKSVLLAMDNNNFARVHRYHRGPDVAILRVQREGIMLTNTIMVLVIAAVSVMCWHIGVADGPRWRDRAFWRAMAVLNALLVFGLFLQ
jgi:hypothetical protein